MANRYIISTTNLVGEDQQKKFAARLTKNDLLWWHWLHNTWLVIDQQERYNAASYAQVLREEFPSAWFVVLEWKGGDWSAYGPTGTGDIENDMIVWLRKHWASPHGTF